MKKFIMERAEIQGRAGVGDWIMHGDVILFKEESFPEDFENLQKIDSHQLAIGELQGHAHQLFDGRFDLREDKKTGIKWLRVVEPCLLRHQEHKEITIHPGDYKIGIQREYSPFEKRTRAVVD